CVGNGSCSTGATTCPPGFACDVACIGNNSCSMGSIICPATYNCSVNCIGMGSCSKESMLCTHGPCDLHCSTGCQFMSLNCGSNACTANCATPSKPTVTCGSSCNCQGC